MERRRSLGARVRWPSPSRGTREEDTVEAQSYDSRLEVGRLPTAVRGFVLLPRFYISQRTFGWIYPISDPSPATTSTCVNADGKIPKNAEIEFPTLVKWSHLRHNGLVGQSAMEYTTHAESGDTSTIKDLYRNGVSISDIARLTGHDRKTIRAVVKGSVSPPVHQCKRRARKLDRFIPYLEKRIEEGVFNSRKLLDEMRRQGYQGGWSRVRAFVHPYRGARQAPATPRFETEPGEQAQVDGAHFGHIEHEGRRRRLYAFVMTLGWSRALYLEFTVSADAAWWLRCHVRAFHYFGGVPRVVLHDNLKTAVLERDADSTIHWNRR